MSKKYTKRIKNLKHKRKKRNTRRKKRITKKKYKKKGVNHVKTRKYKIRGGADMNQQQPRRFNMRDYIPDPPTGTFGRILTAPLDAVLTARDWAFGERQQDIIDRYVNDGERIEIRDDNGNWINTGDIIDRQRYENAWATTIQRLQRGRMARERADEIRRQNAEINQSAIEIQRNIRGLTGRRRARTAAIHKTLENRLLETNLIKRMNRKIRELEECCKIAKMNKSTLDIQYFNKSGMPPPLPEVDVLTERLNSLREETKDDIPEQEEKMSIAELSNMQMRLANLRR